MAKVCIYSLSIYSSFSVLLFLIFSSISFEDNKFYTCIPKKTHIFFFFSDLLQSFCTILSNFIPRFEKSAVNCLSSAFIRPIFVIFFPRMSSKDTVLVLGVQSQLGVFLLPRIRISHLYITYYFLFTKLILFNIYGEMLNFS